MHALLQPPSINTSSEQYATYCANFQVYLKTLREIKAAENNRSKQKAKALKAKVKSTQKTPQGAPKVSLRDLLKRAVDSGVANIGPRYHLDDAEKLAVLQEALNLRLGDRATLVQKISKYSLKRAAYVKKTAEAETTKAFKTQAAKRKLTRKEKIASLKIEKLEVDLLARKQRANAATTTARTKHIVVPAGSQLHKVVEGESSTVEQGKSYATVAAMALSGAPQSTLLVSVPASVRKTEHTETRKMKVEHTVDPDSLATMTDRERRQIGYNEPVMDYSLQ